MSLGVKILVAIVRIYLVNLISLLIEGVFGCYIHVVISDMVQHCAQCEQETNISETTHTCPQWVI